MGERVGAQSDHDPREFFRVSRLIPTSQEIVDVAPGTSVRDALTLMQVNDFDQLPVVAAGQVLGVFSYRSLSKGLKDVRVQDDPLRAPVEDLMEELEFVRSTDRIERILELLDRDGAVLVGEEDRLLAVATPEDVTRFLWVHAEPFVLLEDIELAIRGAMRLIRNDEGIRCDITNAFTGGRMPRSNQLEDLSLGELIMVLKSPKNYAHYKSAFGHNVSYIDTLLVPIVDVRNKVFHFRGDLTGEDMEILSAAHTYLHRRIKILRATL